MIVTFLHKWVPALKGSDKVDIGPEWKDARCKCANCGERSGGGCVSEDNGPFFHTITITDVLGKAQWSEWFCHPCVAGVVKKLYLPPEGRHEAYPLIYPKAEQ